MRNKENMVRMLMMISCIACFFNLCVAQEEQQEILEQEMENLHGQTGQEIEDDSYREQLREFVRHKLNLNTASAAELNELRWLTPLHIDNLIRYRSLLGRLINLNELQAVPGFDLDLIRKLWPYVTINEPLISREDIGKRIRNGEQFVVMSVSQLIKNSVSASPASSPAYPGSPWAVTLRYQYRYKNLLQFGTVMDEDAGEPLWTGNGPDFFSFHLYARDIGVIKRIAVGDYTVNMGQGLVHWQGLGFRKNANVMSVKRHDEIIKPYRSRGEFFFHRGLAITLGRKPWQLTTFASMRSLSANTSTDQASGESVITSFYTAGLHRTHAEKEKKNAVKQLAFGGNLSYSGSRAHLGFNFLHLAFSKPILKQKQPYQLFEFSGKQLTNISLDYDFSMRNIHLFGECALSQNGRAALLHGMLVSLDPRFDMSILFRSLSPAYETIYASAFTENSKPVNERGLFTGFSVRGSKIWRMEMYMDMFSFPWLKYKLDAPSRGIDWLVQLNCQLSRQLEMYARYKNESAERIEGTTRFPLVRKSFRIHIGWQVNKTIELRQRVETNTLHFANVNESGFLLFQDVHFRQSMKGLGCIVRFQFFETDGFDSRIYAYENDVRYNFSIPAFAGKGWRYYFNFHYSMKRIMNRFLEWNIEAECWLRWAQTITSSGKEILNDELKSNKKSSIQFQLMLKW